MTVTFLQLFTLLIQILPAALAVAIFIGTLRLGKRQKSESSATTRGGEQ